MTEFFKIESHGGSVSNYLLPSKFEIVKWYSKGTEILNTCLGHLSLITKNVDFR